MNQSLIQLTHIAKKSKRTVLGLMSGTSADGLDISITQLSGNGYHTKFGLVQFATADYSLDIREKLRLLLFNKDATQADVLKLQVDLEKEWVKLIREELEKWNISTGDIDLVASHGQTVLHLPSSANQRTATWQIVDGDFLAAELGIITISDFRKKHIASGFDGAPLAPLGERLLIEQNKLPAILLNLGGIANFTYLQNSNGKMSLPFSTDTGPASTLIDAAVQHFYPVLSYDESGRIAASAKVNSFLLDGLKTHTFYQKKAPKSTGPEEFKLDWVFLVQKKLNVELSPEEMIATLTKFSAWGIGREIQKQIGSKGMAVYISGGGLHNHTLMKMIGEELPACEVKSSEEVGIPPDAKEAVLFSAFANELIAGEGWELQSGKRFTLGKISFPFS